MRSLSIDRLHTRAASAYLIGLVGVAFCCLVTTPAAASGGGTHPTKASSLHESLLTAIDWGAFKPGTRLDAWWPLTTDDDIQRRRASVREALSAAGARVSGALDETATRTVAWWKLPSDGLDARNSEPSIEALVDPAIPAGDSVSTGDPSDGALHHAAELPSSGDHYEILEEHRSRHTNYATTELIGLLRHAAAAVARRHKGSTLRIGNLSRKGGGDIRWSGSHNSGRDADLAFFAESTATGRDVPTPGLIAFDQFGLGENDRLQFDVARNWSLVRALLTHDGAEIQWLFISQPLKAKLLARARRLDEPSWLIDRASKVLHQPTSAPPHADHLHIRIACPASDRLLGCQSYGPQWAWLETHRSALLARTLAIGRALDRATAPQRRQLWTRLEQLDSPFTTELALRRALRIADTLGRRAAQSPLFRKAIDIADDGGTVSTTAIAMAEQLLDDSPVELSQADRLTLYGVIERGLFYDPAPGPNRPDMATRILVERLTSRDTAPDLRAEAARALSHRPHPDLVPRLIDVLDADPPATLRTAVTRTLKLWTGFAGETDTSPTAEGNSMPADADVQTWRAWWRSTRSQPRSVWLARSFEMRGFDDATRPGYASGDALVRVLTSDQPSWFRTLAARQLETLTGRHLPVSWSLSRQQAYWVRWWSNNRARLLGEETANQLQTVLPELQPPAVTRRASSK